MAGASAGAAIGLIAGPAGVVGGAAAGAAVGRVLKRVGADLQRRYLGPREEVRVGAAAAFAGATVQELLESGQIPREDGFFDERPTGRSAADEILEGVLLRARDEHEERKVPYLGRLFANVAFTTEISPANANHLITLASQLTYRQLVFMASTLRDSDRTRMRPASYRDDPDALKQLGVDGRSLLTEVYDLYQRGLVAEEGVAWISVPDVNPARAKVQGSGHVLAILMGLEQVPEEDREEITTLLKP